MSGGRPVSLSDVFPFVTGAGGALVVLLIAAWMFVRGTIISQPVHDRIVEDKNRQISDLAQALTRERERADAAVLAAQTTKDILQALHREVQML